MKNLSPAMRNRLYCTNDQRGVTVYIDGYGKFTKCVTCNKIMGAGDFTGNIPLHNTSKLKWAPARGIRNSFDVKLDNHRDIEGNITAVANDKWSWFIAEDLEELAIGIADSRDEAEYEVQNAWDNICEADGMSRMEPQWGDITAPNH